MRILGAGFGSNRRPMPPPSRRQAWVRRRGPLRFKWLQFGSIFLFNSQRPAPPDPDNTRTLDLIKCPYEPRMEASYH